MTTPPTHTAPPCGASRCRHRATRSDASGVGYCDKHGDDIPAADDLNPFDPWWAASSIAYEMGGAERRRWHGLEYGEWPAGSP